MSTEISTTLETGQVDALLWKHTKQQPVLVDFSPRTALAKQVGSFKARSQRTLKVLAAEVVRVSSRRSQPQVFWSCLGHKPKRTVRRSSSLGGS